MATTSLGRLTLDLVARIAGYTEPLSRAERETRKSTKAISESFDLASLAVKGFGVVLGGLSVASVVAYSEKVINAGNDIQKFAKLANSSVSQFQYYGKGAETAGISLESFADKMKDMQDRIGDFQQTGGGPLADFFTNIAPRVGVTIQQFQKLSGPEALQLFYNSLEKAGASTNDMKFYMEAIISDSSLLIPLLKNGGKGFKFWGDAAKNAGAIMSDDMVKSLTEAKMNLQLLDIQWQGLQATLVNNVIPVIGTIVENWDKVEAGATALAAVIVTRLAFSFGIAGTQAAASLIQYARYQVALARMAGETITLATVTRGLGGAMLSLVGGPLGLIALGVQVAIAGGTYYAMTRKTEDATDALDMQGKTVAELVEHYKSLGGAKKTAFSYEASQDLKKTQEAFNDAKEAFYYSAVGIAYSSANTDESVKAVDALVAKFKDGKISALDFADGMSKLGFYTDQQIATAVKFAEKSDTAKTALDNQKKVVEALSGVTDKNAKAQEKLNTALQDQARLLGIMPDKWNAYTQKQREALTGILTDQQRQNYVQANMNAGWSKEKAEFFADYRNSAGLGYAGSTLDQDQMRIVNSSFNQKNYDLSPSDKKKIMGAVALVAKDKLEEVAKSKGIPAGMITGLIATESGGRDLTSPTGAKGFLQTTKGFRDTYGLTIADNLKNPAKVVGAASDDLAKNFKKYGNWQDAIMAYNGGRGGVDALKAGRISNQVKTEGGYQKINGVGYLSPAKAKEMQDHAQRVLKYMAGANNSTSVDNSMLAPSQSDQLQAMSDLVQAKSDRVEKEKEINARYYTEEEKALQEHNQKLEDINKTLTGTNAEKRIKQENALYKEQSTQFEVSKAQELNQLKAFETDRITQIRQTYDEEIRLMSVSTRYFGDERTKRIALLERAKQSEIDAVKREENEQVQSAFEAYLNETEIVVKRYQREREEILKTYSLTELTRKKIAESKDMAIFGALNQVSDNVLQYGQNSSQSLMQRLNPEEFARYNLQNQYSADNSGLDSAYGNQISGINLIEDESNRSAQLLEAHEKYLQAKAVLDDEYTQREKDLDQQNFETKMQVYSQISGMVAQTFDQMAGMLEESAGKSNALYKTMFIAGKAASIAQAIVNTEEGATKALAQGGAYGSLLAGVVRATGYASVGMIAGQTIAGMAHDGIDNIPKEGTWLLDKGERVVDSRTNADLKNMIANSGNSGPQINIIVPPGYTAEQSRGADGNVTIDILDKKIKQSWNNLNNPNSFEAKQVQRNTTAGVKRQ